MDNSRTAALQLAAAMAISGTIGLFVREAGVGAFGAVFWRCVIGAAAMLAWCAATGALRDAFTERRDLLLVLLGGACIVANWILVFEAFAWTSITLVTIAYHVQPFWVLLLVRLAYGERTGRDALLWIALAFLGLMLAVGFDRGLLGEPRSVLIGSALAISAALLYAGAAVAAKGIRGTRPSVVTLVHTVMGAVVIGGIVQPAMPESGWQVWSWLIGLGLLHTGFVYVLMYGAYPRLPGATIAVLAFLNPVTALATDAVVYGTRVTIGQGLGLAAILIATLGVNRRWRLRKVSGGGMTTAPTTSDDEPQRKAQ